MALTLQQINDYVKWSNQQGLSGTDGIQNWIDSGTPSLSTWNGTGLSGTTSTTTTAPKTTTSTTQSFTSPTPVPVTDTAQVISGNPDVNTSQINVADYGGQIVTDPTLGLRGDDPSTATNESGFMSDRITGIDENATGTNIGGTNYVNTDGVPTADSNLATASTVDQTAQGTTALGQNQPVTGVNTYDATTISGGVTDTVAAQGTVSNTIDPNSVVSDIDGHAAGSTELGKALDSYATQDLDTIDSRATALGQIAELQSQFQDANGNPIIPSFATAMARNVAKIATFSGMTGSAATAAMANALMEASIPIAMQDAQFFQSVTMANLNNRQQATINKANVLANLESVNMDNRMAAAVQNSKNFLSMDLANLSNEQQANVIDSQQRFQALLEDGNQKNVAARFAAQSANELDQFYANLGQQMETFNASQLNNMEQFNTAEKNKIAQFNATNETATSQFNAAELNALSTFNAEMYNEQEQFYKNMQFNVDVANAQWRQTVTLQENEQQFEAAALDVQNMLQISQEQLNRLWDRSDSLLDYAWQSTENESDRNASIALQQIQSKANFDLAKYKAQIEDQKGFGGVFGTIAGDFVSNFDWSNIF